VSTGQNMIKCLNVVRIAPLFEFTLLGGRNIFI